MLLCLVSALKRSLAPLKNFWVRFAEGDREMDSKKSPKKQRKQRQSATVRIKHVDEVRKTL